METKESVLMQKYEWGKLLGQGNFAKVYHAKDIKNGRSVAIKIIDKDRIFRKGMTDQIKREISVMSLVKHSNVVQLYEVMASKTKVYFVMEYVKGGELLQKLAKGRMKEVTARKYFQQLISAIDFCHSRGVYHRDIKLENLLLDEDGNLKITDFGLSALAQSKRQDGLLHTVCGTPAYVAPEVLTNNGYDGSEADIWSCGVTLFVLLTRSLPFHDSNMMEMYKKIAKAELKYPDRMSAHVRVLLSQMLDPNPNTRICVSKIMENPWFRKGFKPRATRKPKEAVNGADATSKVCESINTLVGTKVELAKPALLNAFDIISLSPGLDLSGIFEDADRKKEVKFTSNQPATSIMSKLDGLAKRLKLKVTKKDGGFLKMQGSKPGRKGLLSINAQIFEFTHTFHLVEMTKADGDTLEYQKLMKEEIRPSLKDIVWTWHGSEPQLHQQIEPPELQLSQVLDDHLP